MKKYAVYTEYIILFDHRKDISGWFNAKNTNAIANTIINIPTTKKLFDFFILAPFYSLCKKYLFSPFPSKLNDAPFLVGHSTITSYIS